MTRITVPRIVLILAAAIGGFWLLEQFFGLVYRIADILLIFGLAWLLKLLLDPLMKRLQRWHIPRPISIAIAYLLLIGTIIGVVLWLVPQVTSAAQHAPAVARDAAVRAQRIADWLKDRGVEVDTRALVSQVASLGGQIGATLAQRALGIAQNILSVLGKIALVITVSVYIV